MTQDQRGAGAPLPDRPSKRWWKVIAPQGRVPLRGTILDDVWVGFWTHWIQDRYNPKGRVVQCEEHEACPFCKSAKPLRWTGYVAAMMENPKEDRVLALSEGAARDLKRELDNRGSLRGLQVVLQRFLPHPNAPVHVKVVGVLAPDGTPPTFDIIPSLMRMWGLSPNFRPRGWGEVGNKRRIDNDPNSQDAFERRQEGERGGSVA